MFQEEASPEQSSRRPELGPARDRDTEWQITLNGNTGCGLVGMLFTGTLNAAGSGTASVEVPGFALHCNESFHARPSLTGNFTKHPTKG